MLESYGSVESVATPNFNSLITGARVTSCQGSNISNYCVRKPLWAWPEFPNPPTLTLVSKEPGEFSPSFSWPRKTCDADAPHFALPPGWGQEASGGEGRRRKEEGKAMKASPVAEVRLRVCSQDFQEIIIDKAQYCLIQRINSTVIPRVQPLPQTPLC